VRAPAAVVGCRLGGKGADGTSSHPKLRERTCTRQTAQDIEGGEAKVFRNVRVLRGQLFNVSTRSLAIAGMGLLMEKAMIR
jgi:hypothetical protein